VANSPERRVVHPRVNENSREETAARGAGHNDGAKSVSGETQARKPSLADFGWDFPFNQADSMRGRRSCGSKLLAPPTPERHSKPMSRT
jgi:hypothetical protein